MSLRDELLKAKKEFSYIDRYSAELSDVYDSIIERCKRIAYMLDGLVYDELISDLAKKSIYISNEDDIKLIIKWICDKFNKEDIKTGYSIEYRGRWLVNIILDWGE